MHVQPGVLEHSSGVLTVVFAGTLLTGFQRRSKMAYFDELTVRRLKILEPDGEDDLIG